jgi:hypothetical protein
MHYLAYGSNLHPIRLQQRVPSATLIGIAELAGFELAFHKRGRDGSGKCNLAEARGETRSVFGAIYVIEPQEKPLLDEAEGNGRGYLEHPVRAVHGGSEYQCFTYRAQASHIDEDLAPYHWYKELVVLGTCFLGMPDQYSAQIDSVRSIQDPDANRRRLHEELLRSMRSSTT